MQPIDLSSLNGAFVSVKGFPHPDWNVIWKWIDDSFPIEERFDAGLEAQRQWLRRLAEHLGGSYRLHESERFVLLTDMLDLEIRQWDLFAEEALEVVQDALDGVGRRFGDGDWSKLPALMFSDNDDYDAYLSRFYDEARVGRFGGWCVREGAVHIAGRAGKPETRHMLAHEIGRACLSTLSMPAWLKEGAAAVATRLVMDEPPLKLGSLRRDRHQRFWRSVTLGDFWGGYGFLAPNERQNFCYELAEILAREINRDNPQGFDEFLKNAHWSDCGESAARAHLGKGLADYAATFLGEGAWNPPKVTTDAGA